MKYLYLTKESLAGTDAWENVMSLPFPPKADPDLLSMARQAAIDYLDFVSAHYFVPDVHLEGVEEINRAARKLIEVCLAMAEAHKREFGDIPEN